MDKIQSIQKTTPRRTESLDRSRKRLCSELSPVKTNEDPVHASLKEIIERLDKQDSKLSMLNSLQTTQTEINTKLNKLQDIESALNSTIARIDDLETKFSDMDSNVENLWAEIENIKKTNALKESSTLSNLQSKERELCYLQSVLIEQKRELKQECTRLKDYSQRHNLLFFGIPESKGENCVHIVDELVGQYMGLPGAWREIDKAHRYGPFQRGKNARPIIVRFKSHSAKELTLSRSSGFRNTQFSVRPHFSDETQRSSTILQKAQRLGKSSDPHCRISGNKLIHKGKAYGVENIEHSSIPLHQIHQRETSDSIGFLGYLSPLSNFHRCDISVNGSTYRSVEHFFHISRAERCNEFGLAAKLNMLDTAREVKQTVNEFKRNNAGKLVLSESDDLDIMKTGLNAKFKEGPLRKFLLSTQNKTIIECNAYDKFWSCGTGLDNRAFSSPSAWTGKNHLGKLLQQLRSELRNDNRE